MAPLIHRLFEWASTGDLSLKELTNKAYEGGLRARKSGTKIGRATIHRILHNPPYMGEVHWHGEVYRGVHTALVQRDTWLRVQDVLDGRYQHQRHGEPRQDFAFTGLIRCGHCDCALFAQIQKEKYIYYHCSASMETAENPTFARRYSPGPSPPRSAACTSTRRS